MARIIAQVNAPRGTTISGPILFSPHGAAAVCGYGKLYLRSATQRTGGVDSSVVRPDCLPCDRQPQPCSARFIGNVGFPDSIETVGGDALAVVGDRDANGILPCELRRTCRHRDAPLGAPHGSVDRV